MLGGYEKQQEYRQHLMNEKTGRSKNKQCCTEKILNFLQEQKGMTSTGINQKKEFNTKIERESTDFFRDDTNTDQLNY